MAPFMDDRVTRRELLKMGLIGAAGLTVLPTVLAACSSTAASISPAPLPVTPFTFALPPGTASADVIDPSKYIKAPPYRIGFSNGWSGNTWRAEMLASLQQEAAKHPDLIKDLIVVDGQGDPNKQIGDVESLIAQKVDAIMTIANSGQGLAPTLAKAFDAGILVMPFNLPVDGSSWTAYTGTDAADKGTRFATWLRDTLGGKGNWIGLGGTPGNSYSAAVFTAARKVTEAAGMTELTYKDTSWSQDTGKTVMTDLLTSYPKIDGIICDGGPQALGAYQAMLAAGRPLIPTTSDDLNGLMKLYEADKAAQPGMKIGILSEPTWESRVALQYVLGLLTGNKTLPRTFTINMQLITEADFPKWIYPEFPDGMQVDTDLTRDNLNKLFLTGPTAS